MKRIYLVCTLLLLFFSTHSFAQFYRSGRTLEYSHIFKKYYYKEPFQVQVGVGQAFSIGDYCKRLSCMEPGRNIHVGGYANLQPGISVGAELDYFQLGAMEKEADTTNGGRISFKGRNLSLSGLLKINLRRDNSLYLGQVNTRSPLWMPYLRLGVGGILYRPASYRNGQAFNARHPEEAQKQYPGLALTFPVGVGVSFRFMYRMRINAEFTFNFTNTDHLDDMGTVPGMRITNDRYNIAAIKVQYAL